MAPKSSETIFSPLAVPLALGLLRLSVEGRPPAEVAIPLLHRALDLGIRVFDTADSYGLDDRDFHYGERLLRQALESWSGPADEVRICTKVGLLRPKGKWVPCGQPKHLRKSVEGSLKALGVESLFLLQLHVRDPRVPYEETLGALAQLQQEGKVQHLGICNASPPEIHQALRHFPVACLQNELSLVSRGSALDGTLELSRQLGIPMLAYRPLGGQARVEKLTKNRQLAPLALARQVTPQELALAAVGEAGPQVIPLVGCTRVSSLESSVQALQLQLTESDRQALAAKYALEPRPEALLDLLPHRPPPGLPSLAPGQKPAEVPAEVVVVMGIQGAGKSSQVESYEAAGYHRLNRDLLGGSLEDLIPRLRESLEQGQRRIVLDNTYPTRLSRSPVIRTAHAFEVPVRCLFLNTPPEEARRNVVERILDRYGRLLGPQEMKDLAKEDPNLPPPVALQRWQESFEPPHLDEGFGVVEEFAFHRRPLPDHLGKGLLLDVDGTLRITRSGEIYPRDPEDIELLPGRKEVLQKWIEQGYRLFFVSNQSGIASGKVSLEAVRACFERTRDLLGLPVQEMVFCPHSAFPVGCFCRKPLPGLGIDLLRRHQLDLHQLIMVGDMESDAAFARGLGIQYFDAAAFFDQA